MENDNSKSTPVADPQQLSEEDNMPNRNSKIVDTDDEAGEKLVSDEEKLNKKDLTEVKFVSSDSQNGDAKIDIETIKIAFAGMGKEELMKFANDPFWVRVRWVMFILFWLLWVAMLAGAIAIIVMAPKCASPAPLKWWEQGPLYEVNVATFKDSDDNGIGDLNGLKSKLEYIEELGATGVIISQIFKSSIEGNADTVEDFRDVDSVYGTVSDVKNLTAAMKEKGLYLVLKMVPNYSSLKHSWFNKSENRIEPYTDYYVWANSSGITSNGNPDLPNNWISLKDEPAWTWSEKRQQFYLHQFGRELPELNFHNPLVVKEIQDILEYWLEQGVSGFILEKTEFLLEDPRLKDEVAATNSYCIHDQYCFYTHRYTRDQDGVKDLLAQWKTVVLNKTDENGMFTVALNFTQVYSSNSSDLALAYSPSLLDQLRQSFSAETLYEVIENWINKTAEASSRPAWELSVTSRIAAALDENYVDGLNMVTLLLPGTPVVYYGDELGLADSTNVIMPWTNDSTAGFSSNPDTSFSSSQSDTSVAFQEKAAKSHLKVFREVAFLRDSPSIKYGIINRAVVNGTVFAYTRVKSGNPGYLVAFHIGGSATTVDLSKLPGVSDELTVHVCSVNYDVNDVQEKSKLAASSVKFSPRSALVLTFVPKS